MARAKTFKSEYIAGVSCKISFPYLPSYGESMVRINIGDSTRLFRLWSEDAMRFYLENNMSSYWAEKIIDYIKSQLR